MSERVGDYTITASGKRFYPLDIRPDDICVEDVAHHLAQINRFNGALLYPLSVAQHAVYVSRVAEIDGGIVAAYQGLHHDDSEAYLADIPRPIKRLGLLDAYLSLDMTVQTHCFSAFNCRPFPLLSCVVAADNLMLWFESARLNPAIAASPGVARFQPSFEDRARLSEVLLDWHPWHWHEARAAFIARHEELEKQL